jgi:hypothetical protein
MVPIIPPRKMPLVIGQRVLLFCPIRPVADAAKWHDIRCPIGQWSYRGPGSAWSIAIDDRNDRNANSLLV